MAKKMIDIELDNDGQPAISAGDFSGVESTREHQRQLLLNDKGDFKENPNICVGAERYVDEEGGVQALMQEITAQFANDGMDVQGVKMNEKGEIISNAEYK